MGSTSTVSSCSISGILLAGGASSRLGRDKALIKLDGETIIQRIVRILDPIVQEIVVVTNSPQRFAFLDLPMVGDIYCNVGALGGLHAGLSAIHAKYGLAVGCDMPFLNPDLLRFMISKTKGYDIVMPRVGTYYEPLHAIYARHCRKQFEQHILEGQRRVRVACEGMHIRYIDQAEIARYDPEGHSFFNINTPQDLERLQDLSRHLSRDITRS